MDAATYKYPNNEDKACLGMGTIYYLGWLTGYCYESCAQPKLAIGYTNCTQA